MKWIFVIIALLGCSNTPIVIREQEPKQIPYASFVYIEYMSQNLNSIGSGSGVIINREENFSFVLTAGHICNAAHQDPDLIRVTNFEGDAQPARILKVVQNETIDLCLLAATNSPNSFPIKISIRKPQSGDTIYNLSAPMGLFKPNLIPFFQGFYIGDNDSMSIFSLRSIGGMSGSMLLNDNYELIGILSGYHRRFDSITYGSSHQNIIDFIQNL